MITIKDKIGYIQITHDKNGKDKFQFIETEIKKIVFGKRKNTI